MIKFDEDKLELVVSSAHGQYIPQTFIEWYGQYLTPAVPDEVLDILKDGPDNEEYWDAWEIIQYNHTIFVIDKAYDIVHNEDLWLIPVGMELPEDWFI